MEDSDDFVNHVFTEPVLYVCVFCIMYMKYSGAGQHWHLFLGKEKCYVRDYN